MSGPPLTQGAAQALWEGKTDIKPVLQVVDLKKLVPPPSSQANASGQQRYRVNLSDGRHYVQAMLATQMVELVDRGDFAQGAIVRLEEFMCNPIHGRRIVIVLNCVKLGQRPVQGSPAHIADMENAGSHASAPASAPAGPPQQQQQQFDLGYGSNRQEKENVHNTSYGAPKPNAGYGGNQQPAQNRGGPYNSGQGNYQGGQQQQPQGSYGNPQQGYGGGGMAGNYQQQQPQHQQQQQQGYGQGQGQGYGGNYQQQQRNQSNYGNQAPQSNYMPRGSISRNEAPVRFVPIKNLNPYLNRWTVKARVTSKSDIKRWHNAKGEGTVFNFEVLDEGGGEIRMTAFKDACEKFYPIIEVGKVYIISKGSLKPANKRWSNLNNDFEVTLESNSTIEPVLEDASTANIPTITFNFKPIMSLESAQTSSIVDVVGVVLTVDSCMTIQRRDGTETQKRTLTIKDDSNASIEVTLWGNYVNDPGQQLEVDNQQGHHPVIAIKAARVGDYKGKTLGTINSTQLQVNPAIPEAARLRHWFDNAGGAQSNAMALNTGGGGKDRRIFLSDIRDENLGTSGKPDYVEVVVHIKHLKTENLYYPACTLQRNGRQCSKKLQSMEDDKWWCETCQSNSTPDFRWILQMNVCDHTDEKWITAFGEEGNEIMRMTANELRNIRETDSALFERATDIRANKWILKLKIAEDNYNDEKRVRINVIKATNPLKPGCVLQESKLLIDLIDAALTGGNNDNNAGPSYGGNQQFNNKKPRTGQYGQPSPRRGGYNNYYNQNNNNNNNNNAGNGGYNQGYNNQGNSVWRT